MIGLYFMFCQALFCLPEMSGFLKCTRFPAVSVSPVPERNGEMGFNYTVERRKFDAEWEAMEAQLLAAGIDPKEVEKFHQEELAVFGERRAYEKRTQAMNDRQIDIYGNEMEDDDCSLMGKFRDVLSSEIDSICPMDRLLWIEEIDSEKLSKKLHSLSEDYLDVLTMWAIEGYSQEEIALKYGISQMAVSKKITKIKKILSEGF